MTVTLDLSPEQEAALKALAEQRGITIEQWFLQFAEQHASAGSITHLQQTNPAEWMRQFREWAERHDRTTPLLSDDAISRESIYSERV